MMKGQFEKASLDLLTVVCRFSRLCCPAGEPATRLSRESRQMQVMEAILVIKVARPTGTERSQQVKRPRWAVGALRRSAGETLQTSGHGGPGRLAVNLEVVEN